MPPRHHLPLKALLFTSHTGKRGRRIVLHSLSVSLLLASSHTLSPPLDIFSVCVFETWELEKDLRKVSTAVQHCSHVEPIVCLTRVYIWDCRYSIYSVSVCVFWKKNEWEEKKVNMCVHAKSYRVCVCVCVFERERHQNECSCWGFTVRGLSPGCVSSSLIDLAVQCQVPQTQWTLPRQLWTLESYCLPCYDEWTLQSEIKSCLKRLSGSHNQDSTQAQQKWRVWLVVHGQVAKKCFEPLLYCIW